MSAPTESKPRTDGPRLSSHQYKLITAAELAVTDAEIDLAMSPDDPAAQEALRAAEAELHQLYVKYRVKETRYASAEASLLVIDVEREHLGKVPSGVRELLEAHLYEREAGVWDAIADMATRGAAFG